MRNKELAQNLPKYSELVEYTEDLFRKKNWIGYLINRLILDYNVRNEDIDLIITKDKNEINDEDNFILVRPRAMCKTVPLQVFSVHVERWLSNSAGRICLV